MITKKTQFTSILAIVLFLLGLVCLSPESLFAQNFSLSVTPEVHYMRIKPGSKVRHTITLENTSDKAITVTPTIYDFRADGTSGRPVLTGKTTFPYLDLESIHNNTLTIPANKRAQLGLLFSVPEDASEKEYPLTVLFQSQPDSSADADVESQLVGAIGSNLIVLVSHNDQLSNAININSISVPFLVDSFKKVTLSPLVKNNHFAATNMAGSVRVKNMFDEVVAEFNIFPDTVLGFSSRELRAMRTEFQTDVEPEPVPFSFKPDFMIGPHTVEVTITAPYTSENPEEVIAYDVFTFFALPIIPSIASIIALLLLTAYIIKRTRN